MSMINQRWSPQFDKLASVIQDRSELETVDFCPSPGNWGDSLINLGTSQFLKAYSIPYRQVSRKVLLEEDVTKKNRVLVVGGGGGWCSVWSSTAPFVSKVSGLYGHVVVLPSTYEPDQVEIVSDCQNVTLVSRDGAVPSGLKDNFSCHDMAFFIDREEGFDPQTGPSRFSGIQAFRHDKESALAESQRPAKNYDLSLLGNAFDRPHELFTILSRFANVSTDRLHIGIAACLMGINVNLYPSKLNKIPGVYAHSVQSAYPHCKLMSLGDL